MTPQSIASVVRQVAAVAAIVMGSLTSALSAIQLPPAVSAVLTAAGAVLLAIEHFVGDPSTGSVVPPVVVAPTPPVVVPVASSAPVPPVVANPPPPPPNNG